MKMLVSPTTFLDKAYRRVGSGLEGIRSEQNSAFSAAEANEGRDEARWARLEDQEANRGREAAPYNGRVGVDERSRALCRESAALGSESCPTCTSARGTEPLRRGR